MTVQVEPIKKQTAYRRELYQRAVWESVLKLDPRVGVRNPVMLVVEVGSVLTTALWIQAILGRGEAPANFIGAVSLWWWFTVLFANFAEAVAEERGKAQAEALRKTRKETQAKKLRGARHDSGFDLVSSSGLHKATGSWSRPTTSSPPTARSWKAWPRWTRAPSPAKARRSSVRPAATAARSPAAHACYRTGWWCR